MAEQTMFDFNNLSKRWSVSKDTLRRAVENNNLRTVYLAGRRLVPLSEVERVDLVGFGPGRKRSSNKAAQ
jgi:hypothetical protein